MMPLQITPRSVAPYVVSGATGVHIFTRMRHLSQQQAIDAPLHMFLLKNTDVLISLSGASVVIWQLAKHKPRHAAEDRTSRTGVKNSTSFVIIMAIHELRQIFTSLLLGLGLIRKRADAGDTQAILGLVHRLAAVVRKGIETVNTLERSDRTS